MKQFVKGWRKTFLSRVRKHAGDVKCWSIPPVGYRQMSCSCLREHVKYWTAEFAEDAEKMRVWVTGDERSEPAWILTDSLWMTRWSSTATDLATKVLHWPFPNAEPPIQGVKISSFWDTLDDTLEESCPILLDTLDWYSSILLSKLIADIELRRMLHFGETLLFGGTHFPRHAKSPPFSRCRGRHW